GVSSSVSLPLVGGSPGGVAVAMLVRVPVAVGSMATVKVKVTVAPTGRLMVVARGPLPLGSPVTTPPPVAPANPRGAAATPAGRESVRVVPLAALGPALLTTMV